MAKVKIGIGAPTYNDSERIINLFTSIMTFTDYPEDQYELVMLDDGTENEEHKKRLREFGSEYDIPFIENKDNYGIPYSWNKLTQYYDCEYMVLFNDDIQICNKDWLKNLVYFLDNNEHVANVGFPLIHIDPKTGQQNSIYTLPDENGNPGRVGAPVGCSFGFRKDIWEQIKNIDGSTGFWPSLVSFYEETSFGFEIAKLGLRSFQLSTPAVEHWGSQTFANNSNLATRRIDEVVLPKEKYLEIMSRSEKLSIPIEKHKELAETENLAYRMDYSRIMFALKWECQDLWNVPQVEVHKRLIDPMEPELTKWIDKYGDEKEAVL